jgi:hypothetical protein
VCSWPQSSEQHWQSTTCEHTTTVWLARMLRLMLTGLHLAFSVTLCLPICLLLYTGYCPHVLQACGDHRPTGCAF